MATLMSGKSSKIFYRILREEEFKKYKKESIEVALSRLHSQGYVANYAKNWSLTNKGRHHINRKLWFTYFPSPFVKDPPLNTIISFDIPETSKVTRNWLRNQIKIFGYRMLQQSLWIGPGPLPSYFLKRLDDLNIRKNIRTFRVTKK